MKNLFKIEDLQDCRNKSGIYFLYNDKDEVVYIGKSRNIYTRILEHIVEDKKTFQRFNFIEIEHETTFEIIEVLLISESTPKYNNLVINNTRDWLYSLPSVLRSLPLGNLENLSDTLSITEISRNILDLAIKSKDIEIKIINDIPDIF